MIDEYVSLFSNERKEDINNADNSDTRSLYEDKNSLQHSNINIEGNLDTEQKSKMEESKNKLQSDYSISKADADDSISLYDYREKSSLNKMDEDMIFDIDSDYEATEAQEFYRPEVDISSNMALKSSSNVA